jgi:hypothetical protein
MTLETSTAGTEKTMDAEHGHTPEELPGLNRVQALHTDKNRTISSVNTFQTKTFPETYCYY